MPKPLPVPFHAQISPGYCLAACAQIVLAYYGQAHDQERLAALLKVEPYLGAPARNVRRLASSTISVTFEEGTLEKLRQWLNADVPVIAFIQAGELSHWRSEFFQHTVVIVDIDETTICMLDPELTLEPIAAPIDEFMLAWGELDYLYAALNKPNP